MGLPNVALMVLALAGLWFLQLVLSLYQSKRFHRRVFELRKSGDKASVGMAGTNWKRKLYVVVVVDAERNIVRAERLSGFTVFANLEPVPEVVGMHLSRLDGETPPEGVSRKAWTAFQNAARFIHEADRKASEPEDESAVVSESRSMPSGYFLGDSKSERG